VKTVLIVDDSAFMRRVVRDIIIRNGYDVVGEAVSGKTAVEKYRELIPDIVMMDVTMEGMSGLEALEAILKINCSANVVMVSSISQEVVVREAIMHGAKGFVVKPFDEKQIIDALVKLFK